MAQQATPPGRSIFVTMRDGLRLHARIYDASGSKAASVLCLAGLTRNSRDFHDLALALSTGSDARQVYALDARGRGLSDHDRNWKNYCIPVETQDVIDFAAAVGLHGIHLVGTSRGGLIAMVLAAAQPAVIGSVVLNDIGPVIEPDGLTRIAGYVGRVPVPVSWKEAGETCATLGRRDFPAVPPDQWEQVARAWYNDKDGKPVPGYDRNIARSMSVKDGPAPELWPQFTGLTGVPMLAIRGENSDILSSATFAQMLQRHPNSSGIVVPGEGHAPLLKDHRTIGAIKRFMAAAERAESMSGRDFAAAQF